MIPAVDIGAALLSPVLIVFLTACLGVLLEAFVPRRLRDEAQVTISVAGLQGALGLLWWRWGEDWQSLAGVGALAVDGPTQLFWALVLVFALLSVLLFAERQLYGGVTAFTPMAAAVPGSGAERDAVSARVEHTEVFPLLLFAVTGMLLFPAANDLLMLFVALEIFSLPLYLLCGLARSRRLLSQEAALKYFLLGSLSSAIFLFGAALLYGYAGGFSFSAIDAAIKVDHQGQALLLAGMLMVMVGLLFKVGAVPFHSWTPDVYMGAPTPVTGFMAVCTKIAAVAALVRVLYVALGAMRWDWQPLLAGIAAVTMGLGVVLGVVQRDVKRMLAYSSIAHAGFLLAPVVGAVTPETGLLPGQAGSVSSIAFYLLAYGFATVGGFAVVTMVRTGPVEQNAISSWAGLGRKHPWVAGVMTLFLLSFAGIPLTAGFIGKWVAFAAAWRGGYWWLVLVAVLMSLVGAYFYLRLIAVMYFQEPDEQSGEVAAPGLATIVVVVVCAAATLVLGLAPGWALDLATAGVQLLR
ncbi:MAG: NADH-quinone oxidoreductase subunit NuoN [Actinomycetia bacterium]|nr:NADH-quinone oxidoreductase subunit NuoN [Actinomycetes bacterium]